METAIGFLAFVLISLFWGWIIWSYRLALRNFFLRSYAGGWVLRMSGAGSLIMLIRNIFDSTERTLGGLIGYSLATMTFFLIYFFWYEGD